jgi:flagellar hook protein FlgE
MSFLRSLFSGVSGLRNQQTMMDVIGNNIANINTVGFKASRATFSELYAQTLQGSTQPSATNGGTNPIQVGLGMKMNSIDTLFTQGSFETTGVDTDLALSGTGFFVVNQGGKTLYTRDGNFKLDSNGQMTNPGTGAILQGKMADALGNIPSGTTLQNLQIQMDMKSPANATTTAKFGGNLDSSAAVGDVVNSSVTVFDALGNETTVELAFTKTGNNAWSWAATTAAPATTASAGTITFDNTNGTVSAVTGSPIVVDPGTGAPPVSFELNLGNPGTGDMSGLTQTAGDSTVSMRSQDGYTSGTLTGITVESTGVIRGTFSNSTKLALGQVMVAEFSNPSGMMKQGSNLWDVSGNSGSPAIVNPGTSTSIVSGALEQSNVDLADEFTKMITAQRGFQANARVITTSDEILQEVVALKR